MSSLQSRIRICNDMDDDAARLSGWVSSDGGTSPKFEPLADSGD